MSLSARFAAKVTFGFAFNCAKAISCGVARYHIMSLLHRVFVDIYKAYGPCVKSQCKLPGVHVYVYTGGVLRKTHTHKLRR